MTILTINGAALPASTVIKTDGEIIWSSNTGRTPSGAMAGDVVVEKKMVMIEWGVLRESEVAKIRKNLIVGFSPFIFNGGRGTNLSTTLYQGTTNKEHIGFLGDGIYRHKKVTVKVIQR